MDSRNRWSRLNLPPGMSPSSLHLDKATGSPGLSRANSSPSTPSPTRTTTYSDRFIPSRIGSRINGFALINKQPQSLPSPTRPSAEGRDDASSSSMSAYSTLLRNELFGEDVVGMATPATPEKSTGVYGGSRDSIKSPMSPSRNLFRFKNDYAGSNPGSPYSASPVGSEGLFSSNVGTPPKPVRKITRSPYKNVGMNESNPQCPLLSARNVENTPSKSVKRSNKTNKELSEAKVSEFSGESKADRQWETLKDGSSQPNKKSSKRKRGTKDQSNNGSACRRKILGEENVDGTETQGEENLLNYHARVVKRDLLKGLISPTESEKTITISIPYLEIVDQKICHLGNTSEILGKATLKQMYLLAYHFVLKALYLRGSHNWKIETLLTDLREALHISNEEHANELRSITSGQYKIDHHLQKSRGFEDCNHKAFKAEFTNQRLAQNYISDGSMFEKRPKSDPIITALVKAKYRSMEIPQVDGVNDNLDSTVADEGNIEAKDQEQQALNDVASLKVSEDEEPLNDKDDDPDDLDQTSEDPKTDDLVLAQFEKVSRTKNRWKCILKDGVMHLNNKDIVFSKATGEFEF